MKKIIGYSFVVFMVAALLMGCSSTEISMGDKTVEEVAASQEIFQGQIEKHQEEIARLEADNKDLFLEMSKPDLSKNRLENLAGKIKANEALISGYRARITSLEDMADDLIVRSAGSDQQKHIRLNGRDVKEAAEAYMMIKYADGVGSGSYTNAAAMVERANNNPTGLKAILENNRNDDVIAIVSGPGRFRIEFKIMRKSKSQVFQLPCPGEFTTTFVSCENMLDRESVRKYVGPGTIYYDGLDPYDYKATAIRKN